MSRPIRPADFATPHSPWRTAARQVGGLLIGLGLLVAIVMVGVAAWQGDISAHEQASEGQEQVHTADQRTVLWAFTELGTGKALAITLIGESEDLGTQVLFIPTNLLTHIPGIGTDILAMASQYGGPELLVATVENMVGITIDGAMVAPSGEMGAWYQAGGGVEVTVPSALTGLPDAQGERRRIEKGKQLMTGPEVISYMGFYQHGESELDTFTRHETVWKALGELLGKEEVAKVLLDEPFPGMTRLRQVVTIGPVLRSLHQDKVSYTILPVKPLGNTVDVDTTFAPDWKALRTMVASQWAGSLPEGSNGVPRPIQILNGVGEPGIGQAVDAALAGLNLRVVSTENADTFTRQLTEVVVYSDDPAIRAIGEAIVAKLGAGRLVKSSLPQSVVDVTIVVGADFLEAQRKVATPPPPAAQPPADQAPAPGDQAPAPEVPTPAAPVGEPAAQPTPSAAPTASPEPSDAAQERKSP